jgi:hypothetical protein
VQEVLKGQLPSSGRGLSSQGGERFGREQGRSAADPFSTLAAYGRHRQRETRLTVPTHQHGRQSRSMALMAGADGGR